MLVVSFSVDDILEKEWQELDVLRCIIEEDEAPDILPNHEFFNADRWTR